MIDRLFHCRVTTVSNNGSSRFPTEKRIFAYQQTTTESGEAESKPAFQIETRNNLNFNKARFDIN